MSRSAKAPQGTPNPDNTPKRVAVIGGGCAAMAAAFELTRPERAGEFEVTVYQLGWRLGGKGASGRGPGARIEEHGLHLWMGFYENAFQLMRECYAELDRDPARCRIARFEDAFSPQPDLGIAELVGDGSWDIWRALLPADDSIPGDPDPDRTFTMGHYMARLAGLARTMLQGYYGEAEGPPPPPGDIQAWMWRFTQLGQVGSLTSLVHGVRFMESALEKLPATAVGPMRKLLDMVASSALQQLRTSARKDPSAQRIWTLIDLTFATMRGILAHGLLTDPRGFDAISHFECREWLMLNGASQESVDSGYMRGLYDLIFAYEEGDPERPSVDAGQALRGIFRSLFGYRGAFFWKMHAGMGDIVFTPFYEVLKRRGVRFEFFHRLTNVGLADDVSAPHVERLEFQVQARMRDTEVEYQPLVDIEGLPCWPAAPLRDQIEDPEDPDGNRDYENFWDERCVEHKTLRVTDDFDFVVLGVGLGAVPHLCSEFIERDPRWRAMVQRMGSVATQAFQLWLTEDMAALGRDGEQITVSGFLEPFDTWADMRHLIREEHLEDRVRAIAYFCNALPDPTTAPWSDALAARAQVRDNVIRFLDEDIQQLWPLAHDAQRRFRWSLLARATRDSTPLHPIDGQYLTANVNPSDRYSQSLPGSAAFRISPLDDSYDNFTVAGDWTACGFNAGCVEAAAMSGRLAAHALSGAPALEDIFAFDHP